MTNPSEAHKIRNDLAPHEAEARTMNVRQFAERHHQLLELRLWGNPPTYVAVRVDGTDYLWSLTDGKYDGWDRGTDD